MRVLAVTHSLGANGAALCLYRLLVAVKQAGGSVDVLYNGNEMYVQSLREHGIGLIDKVQAEKYDVALVNTLFDCNWVKHISTFLPVVFWVHEGASSVVNAIDSAKSWIRAFDASSRVVFDSASQINTIYRSFLDHVEPHRISPVAPGAAIAPEVARQFNRNKAGSHIVSIGSVYPRKRPADIVSAVIQMKDPTIHCSFVGSVEWLHLNEQAMQDTVASHPHLFTLAGEVTEAQKLQHIRNADVFCSASADETFGIAAVEAASMGVPLALSDLPCYEGIWKHGVNALLAPVFSVDCLSWNLKALLLDRSLASRLAQAGLQTSERFKQERFLRDMTNVLTDAIQDPVKAIC